MEREYTLIVEQAEDGMLKRRRNSSEFTSQRFGRAAGCSFSSAIQAAAKTFVGAWVVWAVFRATRVALT
ncbi:MAG: hypothetical protein ABI939_05450 [Anaerolineaceae bacterium]